MTPPLPDESQETAPQKSDVDDNDDSDLPREVKKERKREKKEKKRELKKLIKQKIKMEKAGVKQPPNPQKSFREKFSEPSTFSKGTARPKFQKPAVVHQDDYEYRPWEKAVTSATSGRLRQVHKLKQPIDPRQFDHEGKVINSVGRPQDYVLHRGRYETEFE